MNGFTIPTKDAKKTLRKNGRSFYFASLFLGKAVTDKAARLYHFCRVIDDIADHENDSKPISLDKVKGDIQSGNKSSDFIGDFLTLCEEENIDPLLACHLLDGVISDTDGPVRIKTRDDLIRYSYRVAGTVGLMMSSILKTSDEKAKMHAIDLGIAMQLTNICRDVLEDAQSNRRYLPNNMTGGLSPLEIENPKLDQHRKLKQAIADILGLADDFYKSGKAGLYYLPPRHHLAILIAANIYRAIGTKIRRAQYNVWDGRHVVSLLHKMGITVISLVEFGFTRLLRRTPPKHDSSLHVSLQDLPGAQEQLGPSAFPEERPKTNNTFVNVRR